jgi:hypothetical protein
MKSSVYIAVLLTIGLTACDKKAAETPAAVAKVEITSPVDGAKLSIKAENRVDYNITLGGEGDHAHIYVDDRRIGMLRKMQGSYSIDYLDPGKREICIKIVNSNHTPTGVGRCVTITAE